MMCVRSFVKVCGTLLTPLRGCALRDLYTHGLRHGLRSYAPPGLRGVKESFITRIVHGDASCTFETAGRGLHALGGEAGLGEKAGAARNLAHARSSRVGRGRAGLRAR